MKRYIIPAVVLIVATIGFFAATEFLSYHSVSFTLDPSVTSVSIHPGGDSDEAMASIKTITPNDTSTSLKEGEYYYLATGDDISVTQVPFSVTGDLTITVKPYYSLKKLNELAASESRSISAALAQKYPTTIKGFETNNLSLFQRGDWAGVVLSPVGMDVNNPEGYYRAVLHKVGGQWQVVGKPQLVLTLDNTPGVSRELLTSVNELSLR